MAYAVGKALIEALKGDMCIEFISEEKLRHHLSETVDKYLRNLKGLWDFGI